MLLEGMTLSGGFSLTPPPPTSSINYLIVGGGGGGGAGDQGFGGGGGGGGGQVLNTTLSGIYQGTSITVTVGAGGTAGIYATSTPGTLGTNSSIAISGTISALPGQYGTNGSSIASNPWGGTSGSGNMGGYGYNGQGYGSSGGGDATVGFNYNSPTYPTGGGWGTLVSAFNMYGTTANNYSAFTLSNVSQYIGPAAPDPQTVGMFNCDYSPIVFTVGMAVTISGTKSGTGSITGYTNPTTYYIVSNNYYNTESGGYDASTNGITQFQLSATLGGSPITTSPGTLTGLTYTVIPSTATKGYFGGGGAGGQWWGAAGNGPNFGGRGGGGNSPNGDGDSNAPHPNDHDGGPGTQNTGGGGGGGAPGWNGGTNQGGNGGAGGSGIVIISYPVEYAAASATTGSPTVTTSNGYRYYAYTSSGSLTI
jgi:hypothetical protein